MIELTNGDMDSLEGRVLIYGKFQNGDEEYAIMAIYASTDIVDFSEKTGVDPNVIKRNRNESIKTSSGQPKSGRTDSNVESISLASLTLNENDIETYDCDRLYAQAWDSWVHCYTAIMTGLVIYLSRYGEQLTKKHKMNPVGPNESLTKYDPNETSVDLGAYISERFVSKMFLHRDLDHGKFEDLRQEFIAYSRGSPIFNDVLALCRAIEAQAPTEVIELTIEKINAIHIEDYARAAEIRDELKLD